MCQKLYISNPTAVISALLGGWARMVLKYSLVRLYLQNQEQLSNLAFCPPEEVLWSTALLAILFKEWTYDDKLLWQLHKLKKDIKKPPVSHPRLSEAKLNLANPAWNLLKEINTIYVFFILTSPTGRLFYNLKPLNSRAHLLTSSVFIHGRFIYISLCAHFISQLEEFVSLPYSWTDAITQV